MPDGPMSAPVERLRLEHETHWRHRQGFTVLPGPGCGSAGARPTTVVKGIAPTSGFFETGVKVRYVRGIQRDGFINLTISSRLISPRFRSPRCGPARRCGCALRRPVRDLDAPQAPSSWRGFAFFIPPGGHPATPFYWKPIHNSRAVGPYLPFSRTG